MIMYTALIGQQALGWSVLDWSILGAVTVLMSVMVLELILLFCKNTINYYSPEDEPPRLKIKWRSKKTDETNGGYSYDILHRILQKVSESLRQ